uniref:Uncharacterized protein n=1 Tax=Anguilla anguilla TaxID=7936 RepID=A0A0E9ULQ9_ANGAN
MSCLRLTIHSGMFSLLAKRLRGAATFPLFPFSELN